MKVNELNNRLLIMATLVLGIAAFAVCLIPDVADADGDATETSYVATIGDTGYEDLTDALEAAMGTTATIELISDATITTDSPGTAIVTASANTKLTLNLNGHTITSNTRLIKIDQSSNGTEIIINAGNGGKIDVGSQRIIANICSSYASHVDAKVTINGGEYKGDYIFMLYNLAEFTMSNATLTAPTAGIWLGNNGVQKLALTNVSVTTSDLDSVGIYLGTVKEATLTNVTVDSASTAIEVKSGTVRIDGSSLTAGEYEAPSGYIDHNGSGSGKAVLNINNAYCPEAGVQSVNVNVTNTTLAYKTGVTGKAITISDDESEDMYNIAVSVAGKTMNDMAYLSQTDSNMTFNGTKLDAYKATIAYIGVDEDTGDSDTLVWRQNFATLGEASDLFESFFEIGYVVEGVSLEIDADTVLPQGTFRVYEDMSIIIDEGRRVEIPSGTILQIDGWLLSKGVLDNKGSMDINGYVGFEGEDARFYSSGVLAVKGFLVLDDDVFGVIDTSIKARNGTGIHGLFIFGDDNTIKFGEVQVGQGGLVVQKGSIQISGGLVEGSVELKGQINVVDDLDIGAAGLKILSGSNVTVPADVELTGTGTVTNAGTLSIHGLCSTTISNTGKVYVIEDGQRTGSYIGDQNDLKEIPFQIKKLSRMTFSPGESVRIVLENIPSTAVVGVKMTNSETCWLTVGEDGKTLTGTAPSRAEVYRVTVTATQGTYTDEIQFDVSVTAPTVEPVEEESDKAIPWALLIIAVVVLGVIAGLTKGRIW